MTGAKDCCQIVDFRPVVMHIESKQPSGAPLLPSSVQNPASSVMTGDDLEPLRVLRSRLCSRSAFDLNQHDLKHISTF
jgi:hypothetical protein